MDKFTYLGSSVSLTESDISMRPVKAWTAIEKLSIKWKFNLSDKIKRNFFYCMDAPYGLWRNVERKSLMELHKNATSYIEQILEATSHKIEAVRPRNCHL